MKFKRAKLRGVESQGMICSAKELGLPEKLLPKSQTEGILVLPENTEIGQSVVSLFGLDDVILELGLTPNRSDCLSMIGVAYEVAAILDRKVKLPEYSLVETGQGENVSIDIKASEDCTRYAAIIVRNVRIEASPLWMQERLMAAGIRPINNIVDITNYVMLAYGQPLHAFDFEQLAGPRIVVRSAKAGELFVTLDDTERKLTEDMLLITDSEKPIAIAGVMGGANSEVTANTKHIVIESAVFRGGSIRKTSRQLGLRSEASARFEKGVNPEAIIPALNYAAHLMSLYAGGEIESETADENLLVGKPNTISLRVERLNAVTGASLSEEEVFEILERLAFDVTSQDQSLSVTVPSRRGDIFREEDLIEEVIRLYGYDNIPTTLPVGEITLGHLTRSQKIRRTINRILVNLGWNETVNYGLTHTRNEDRIAGLHDNTVAVALALPMSEARSRIRSTLFPKLLEVAQYNRNRGMHDLG
ncbi:MAG: phenylalanine--tRNA ligase subunit beta, partial [Bacilli bacterium]